MASLRPLIPLLLAAGILLAGNGMQGTLIALRGADEGFSPAAIGLMGTAYFAGFLIGCFSVPRLLRRVGHIRTFASLAALASAGTLLLVLAIDPLVWGAVRLLTGICFAGLFTVMESWINAAASNTDRARVLAVYRIVDIVAVTGSQYLIPVFGVDGFTVFAVMAIMITLSLVPVSAGDRSNPQPPEAFRLDLAAVWRISPLAAMGCVAIGMTNGAFRLIGPVYAQEIGLTTAEIATFISAGIIGGAVMQYPLGAWSDRHGRRGVLLVSTTLAMAAALAILFLAGDRPWSNFLAVFFFGAFAMPLYSLSAAHANDHAGKGEFVQVAAGLMFFYSIGAIVGPTAASWLMERFGPSALFAFSAAVYAGFIALTLYRMGVRPSVPAERRRRFIALLRTSPVFARLARRGARERP